MVATTTTPSPPAPGAAAPFAAGLARLGRSPVLRLVVRRLLQAIPVIWGATFIAFCLMNLLPGTAADALLGENATPGAVAALNHNLGLDEPFLLRYVKWLGHALTGDLGTSLASHQSVTGLVVQRLGISGELILLAFLIALVLAIPVAALAARRPHGLADRISMAVSTMGLSVPSFVLSLVLVLVFAVELKLLPPLGFVPIPSGFGQNLKTVVLPSLALSCTLFCVFSRLLRADLIDQMQGQDYITTARAKGVHPWQVLIRHALRNSLFGLLTVIGMEIGGLIGSTVVVEQVFAVPGVGQQLMSAIQNQDVPVVEGVVVLIATVTVLANLVTDLLYTLLDPRIRHDRPRS